MYAHHGSKVAGAGADAAPWGQVESFYEFYEGLQEGWDGPALLVFASQGKIGARLDRNGLRPARYWKTSDDLVYVASEVGVLNDVLDNAPNITVKGRLGPGQVGRRMVALHSLLSGAMPGLSWDVPVPWTVSVLPRAVCWPRLPRSTLGKRGVQCGCEASWAVARLGCLCWIQFWWSAYEACRQSLLPAAAVQ